MSGHNFLIPFIVFFVLFVSSAVLLIVVLVDTDCQTFTKNNNNNNTDNKKTTQANMYSSYVPNYSETYTVPIAAHLHPYERPIFQRQTNQVCYMSFKQDQQQQETTLNKIPKIIFQTYTTDQLPRRMFNAVSSVIHANHEYTYMFFDDVTGRQFIADFFPDNVTQAFDMLIPGAYKADILRLCLLYIYGGWYIDISMCMTHSDHGSLQKINDCHPDAELLIVKDNKKTCQKKTATPAVYQAFIGAKKNSKHIKFILDGIVERVLERYMPMSPLGITGPIAFGQMLNRSWDRDDDEPFEAHGTYENEKTHVLDFRNGKIKLNNTNLLTTKYKDWKKDRLPGSHYSDMFKRNQVYHASYTD